MKNRISITLDSEIQKKIQNIQAEKIIKTQLNCSFSGTLNEILVQVLHKK